MASTEAVDPAIAWLQGFLHAFAWFNNKSNCGFTFTLDLIPKPTPLQQAIETYFKQKSIETGFEGNLKFEFTLSPVAEWQDVVRELYSRWWFQFSDPSSDHLHDPKGSFSLFIDYFRGMILDEMMVRMSKAFSPVAVWKVEMQGDGNCCSESLALEEQERILFLNVAWFD
ncbi:MAG: hypothetical protein WEB58_16505 [Planctomycetaceae bacterium]